MELKTLQLVSFWLILLLCSYVLTQDCPKQCQCQRGEWDCESQNITNDILREMVKFGDAERVGTLKLKNNLIKNFPAEIFKNFTILQEIDLGENLLEKPPKNLSLYIPSLKTIFLNSNNISSVTMQDFTEYDSLRRLDIFGNKITELSPDVFSGIPQLRKLYAEGNSMKLLGNVFSGLDKLIWLTFQGNQIERINPGVFDDNTALERVWIGDNKLRSLPEGLFKNAKNIFILDISKNQLTNDGIPDGIFNVEDLFLQFNNLTTLKKEWFHVIKYKIDLRNNPIHCDCHLHDTYRHLSNKSSNMEIVGECASPLDLKGQKLSDVLIQNLVNCDSCSLNECQNNGTCTVIDANTYSCNCTDMYYGDRCNKQKFCHLEPCLNNATCSNTDTTYECGCVKGFLGKRCEVEQPCFFTNPCQNNGTCLYVNGTNSYNCVCQGIFSGVDCTLVREKEDGLAPGYIVLIVLLVLAFVGVVLVYVCWKRKQSSGKATMGESTPLSGGNKPALA